MIVINSGSAATLVPTRRRVAMALDTAWFASSPDSHRAALS